MPACPTCGQTNPPGARFCNACGARLPEAAAEAREPSGERRVVTMLFCDVRGSTSMAEQLDPEAWTDVMNAAYEHLIAPVYRHEGTVARLMGDAILAFFGAPTAHEDDPQRAVMAGLEIVSSVGPFRERLARERGLDLNVRVGINTGPVVVGDVGSELRREYSAMGDAVNVAARMEQTAEPGTVQITEDTYRLVADLFEVESLGGVELKGKSQPVPSYRVLRRLDAPWRVRAVRGLDTRLVGREAELSVVRSALTGALADRGSVVLIVGEPGLGKSRLVEEANALWSEIAPEGDRPWDLWQCVPFDTMQPYAQYRRQIRERAGVIEADTAETVRTKIAALMAAAPPGWRERSERVARALLGVELEDEPHLEGEAFQQEATELVVGSTTAFGDHRLVVFEDLHWCDHASLELVRETIRLAAVTPIAFLVTFRPERDAIAWGLKEWAETELADRTSLIELGPLSSDQSDELVEELLPVGDVPDEVRSRLFEKAEGNPLFLQEVARDLIDRGLAERTADGWRLTGDVAEVAIPDTVQSLITVGLDRLPASARRTLQAAAVIGRDFDEEILLGTAQGDDDVRADLRELEARDLIRAIPGGSSYTFRHALTQEAAYGTLLVRRRRAVHLRVARALEAANADRPADVAAALVRHFGEAGEDEATLRYAELAGDAAARLYANAEAQGHFRVALDAAARLDADPALVRSLFARRGNVLELAGRHDEAIANYEEMRRHAQQTGNQTTELMANSAIAALYSTPSPLFDADRGRALSEETVAMARRLGDRAAEARALWNIVVANIYGGGDPARAVEAGEDSIVIARDLGDHDQLAFTLNDVSRAHMANGDLDTAARRLEAARELWQELDNRAMLGENLTVSAELRLLAGDHEGAMSEAREALALAESIDNRWGQSYASIVVYRIRLDLGDIAGAMASMQRSLELGEEGGFAFAGMASRAELAMIHARAGDADRALPLAERALELAREQLPVAAPFVQGALAEARLAAGDVAGARAALDAGEPGADWFLGPEFLGPEPGRTSFLVRVGLVRSRVALADGRAADAAAHAVGMIEYLRSRGVRVLVAEVRVLLARALTVQGRFEDAERELEAAAGEAERLGERLVLADALALLAGARARRGSGEADQLAERARAIVEEIARDIEDAELRRRFLEVDRGSLPAAAG